MLVHTGKYRTDDTETKYKTEKSKQHKTQQNKTTPV